MYLSRYQKSASSQKRYSILILLITGIIPLIFVFTPNSLYEDFIYPSQNFKKMYWDLRNIVNDFHFDPIFFPLLMIGLVRVIIWSVKKGVSLFYKPIESTFKKYTKYSIITTVYNEDPLIFEKAIESWIKNKPDEIIAVIDKTDIKCIKIFQAIALTNPILKLIITKQKGKRPALMRGIRMSKNEIIALVDSDTIWSLNIKDALLSPFNDPEIGGVTTRQHIIERKTIWQKVSDIYLNMRNFYELPSLTAAGRTLSCLAGRTSLYKKNIIEYALNDFVNETILDRKKESGEDKYLTRIVHQQGFKTYYQSNAVVYSNSSRDFKSFWKQRVRWCRNSYNSDLVSLWNGGLLKHPFLSFHLIDRFISIFTLLFIPIYIGIMVYSNHYILAALVLTIWVIGRGIKLIPHFRLNPSDIALLPAYVGIHFMVGMIKLYGLITIRDQKGIRTKNNIRIVIGLKTLKNFFFTSEIVFLMVFSTTYLIDI